MANHVLKRALLAIGIAVLCTGCEGILGFGDTSVWEEEDAPDRDGSDVGVGNDGALDRSLPAFDATAEDSPAPIAGDDASDEGRGELDVVVIDGHDAGSDADVHSGSDSADGDRDVSRDDDAGPDMKIADASDDGIHDAVDVSVDPVSDPVVSDVPARDGTEAPDIADVADARDIVDLQADVPDSPEAPMDVRPDVPPWTPLDLSGLAIWLDGDQGLQSDGGAFTSWLDRSPNQHQAVPSSLSHPPTALGNGIGLHPGVSFAGDGDGLQVADQPSLNFGTNDFLVEVVLRHSTPIDRSGCDTHYAAIFLKSQRDTAPFRGVSLFANIFEVPAIFAEIDGNNWVQTPGPKAYNDDVPRVIGLYRRAQTFSIRINGVSIIASNTQLEDGGVPLNVDAVGYDLYLGAQPNPTQCLVGVIAEVIAVSPARTSDVTAVETYLLQKYADVIDRDN